MIASLYKHFLSSTGVTTDSRKISENVMFFALRGENFDGNAYALKALENGASCAVVDDDKLANLPGCFLVDNVYSALADLAKYHRKQLKCPVIAITGTNGKTTTKELIVRVLHEGFNLTFTHGNLNNHIGLPLTILTARHQTELMILEMGANHPGEIDFLCQIAQPDYGLITNVGKAHLEGFKSPQAIFNTKTELYRYIIANGRGIFVNADDKELSMAASEASVLTYGINSGEIQGNIISGSPLMKMEWQYDGKKFIQPTQLFGSYNIYNVLAAVTCGLFFKIPPKQIVQSVAEYYPQNNRSQFFVTDRNNHVILDAYNANPSSMTLALDDFFKTGTRKCVILGSMLELGDYSEEEHRAVLNRLSETEIEMILLVGKEFRMLKHEFSKFSYFADCDELLNFLKSETMSDMHILIKGSRANTLENVVKYL